MKLRKHNAKAQNDSFIRRMTDASKNTQARTRTYSSCYNALLENTQY